MTLIKEDIVGPALADLMRATVDLERAAEQRELSYQDSQIIKLQLRRLHGLPAHSKDDRQTREARR